MKIKCESKFGIKEVEAIDKVYRRIQFDAEYMSIDGSDVALYYPTNKKDLGYLINGKSYDVIYTNLFIDRFENMIKSTNILISHLNLYRAGWKVENCIVRGELCVYDINKDVQVNVHNSIMKEGTNYISVGYWDKKQQCGSGGPFYTEREVIEELNSIFDKYTVKTQIAQIPQNIQLSLEI